MLAYGHGLLWVAYRIIALLHHPGAWTFFALGFSLLIVLYRWRTR